MKIQSVTVAKSLWLPASDCKEDTEEVRISITAIPTNDGEDTADVVQTLSHKIDAARHQILKEEGLIP